MYGTLLFSRFLEGPVPRRYRSPTEHSYQYWVIHVRFNNLQFQKALRKGSLCALHGRQWQLHPKKNCLTCFLCRLSCAPSTLLRRTFPSPWRQFIVSLISSELIVSVLCSCLWHKLAFSSIVSWISFFSHCLRHKLAFSSIVSCISFSGHCLQHKLAFSGIICYNACTFCTFVLLIMTMSDFRLLFSSVRPVTFCFVLESSVVTFVININYI